jgi:predicted RNA binding protein YcfA (HicA-like mRNA interferase family)
MPKLPVCSGEEVIKAFKKMDWIIDRQKGSHVSMIKREMPVVLTIPLHNPLDRGLLRALIRRSGLSVEEFIELLD